MKREHELNRRVKAVRAFDIFNKGAASLCLAAMTLSSAALAAASEAEDVGALLQSGRYQEALNRIDALPGESRRHPQIRLYRGMSLMAQDRRAEALRDFEALAADHPDMPEPFNNMAVIQAANGHYGEARMLLQQSLRADPRYSVALENIGDLYIKMANHTYARLRTLDPKRKSAKARHEKGEKVARLIDHPPKTKHVPATGTSLQRSRSLR